MTTTTLLRMPELTKRLGLARSTIYKIMRTDGFPKPIKLTSRAVAWDPVEVQAFLDRRRTRQG